MSLISRDTFSRGKPKPYGFIITRNGLPVVIAHAAFSTVFESNRKKADEMARLTVQNITAKSSARVHVFKV